MLHSLLPGFIQEATLRALGWTLIHSIWIGLICSLVAGVVIASTRSSKPTVRYNLLVGILISFLAGTVSIFIYELREAIHVYQLLATQQTSFVVIPEEMIVAPSAFAMSNRFYTPLLQWLDANTALIVYTWLVVLVWKSLALAKDLYGVHRLRTRQTFVVDEVWNERIKELAQRLQIKKAVQLLESGIAKVPMAMGHLTPVILLPVGLLTALSPAEIEAILLHELAHIQRRDYLVNLMQRLVEIAFFFNPAVMWISSLIKIERENVADDVAVSLSDSKTTYIKALVAFQEYNQSASPIAAAITGPKDFLLQRVKRIVYNTNKPLNSMEKLFVIVCVFFTGILTITFAKVEAQEQTKQTKKTAIDTLPSPQRQVYVIDSSYQFKKVKKHIQKTSDSGFVLIKPNFSTAYQAMYNQRMEIAKNGTQEQKDSLLTLLASPKFNVTFDTLVYGNKYKLKPYVVARRGADGKIKREIKYHRVPNTSFRTIASDSAFNKIRMMGQTALTRKAFDSMKAMHTFRMVGNSAFSVTQPAPRIVYTKAMMDSVQKLYKNHPNLKYVYTKAMADSAFKKYGKNQSMVYARVIPDTVYTNRQGRVFNNTMLRDSALRNKVYFIENDQRKRISYDSLMKNYKYERFRKAAPNNDTVVSSVPWDQLRDSYSKDQQLQQVIKHNNSNYRGMNRNNEVLYTSHAPRQAVYNITSQTWVGESGSYKPVVKNLVNQDGKPSKNVIVMWEQQVKRPQSRIMVPTLPGEMN
ncbi:beta-lactamase regulating signal transducer with metallopeptidase domain [Chitinophaga skermanii]|uniref:Beta-lactamase regulating signal transducer with metallopeptidase domain n=1 Tax=Chitinophaga skermanii TaxID=331697 RepID=A0A327QXS2_9BACT|nr:M56 family metallopeptidase [Chitinophaga skermanii]RAJ08442.1 beta-lactamase regulating signal transducer with metallopeptidase domain [Chitinophaga skermanii]